MDANNRGKRSKDKPKDAAEGAPMRGEKERMEEEDASRVAIVEKELNGLKDDVNEIKASLTRLTEGKLAEGRERKRGEEEGGFEPKEETGDNQQGRRQQSPQPKVNSKKGYGRLDHETLARL